MEEAKVLRIALESLQQQLSMLQKTLERLTEQNQQKDERIEELTQMLLNIKVLPLSRTILIWQGRVQDEM